MTITPHLAVITGASRGLGLETARELAERGHHVVITARQQDRIDRALSAFGDPDAIEGHVLDVADEASVKDFFDWLAGNDEHVDILINNAGRMYGGHGDTIAQTAPEALLEAIDNNAISAYRMIRHALPVMNANGYGRIVNVSSGMGALTDMGSGTLPYRISKTAMNAITILASREARGDVKVNAVCPGWVRTDMGGPNAHRSLTQGAAGIVWAATLGEDGPNGGFFRDGKPIDW